MNPNSVAGSNALRIFIISLAVLMVLTPGRSARAQADQACTQLPAGLASWWPGDGNANDVKGTNHGSMQAGATFSIGMVGEAFGFDGTSAVEIPSSSTLKLGAGDLTIDAWIKTSAVTGYRAISGKFGGPPGFPGIILRLTPDGKIEFAVTDCGAASCGWGDTRQPVRSPMRVDDNSFHHIAGVRQSNGYELYIDGQLVATRAEQARNSDNDGPLFIGREAAQSEVAPFAGIIDELSIYSRALEAAEIEAIFIAASAGKCKPPSLCALPPSSLTSWWPADGDANDIKSINNGILSGDAITVPGLVQQAFKFSGDGAVIVPDHPSLNPTRAFSVNAWVNPSTFQSGAPIIVSKESVSGLQYEIAVNNFGGGGQIGDLIFYIGGVGGLPDSGNGWTSGGGRIPLNQWTHVALTVDLNAGKINTYINGALKQDYSVPTTFYIFQTAADFRIGNRMISSWGAWTGLIDEVEFYSRALSAAEVKSIFNAGSAGNCRASENGQPWLASLTLSPNPVSFGQSSTVTATLTGAAAAGGAVVVLASSNSALAAVPPSISISDGSTSGSFNIIAGAVSSTATAKITATLGESMKITALTVDPLPPPLIVSISPSASTRGLIIPNFTVRGNNFQSTSILSFSGTGIAVNSYSSRTDSQIVASITLDRETSANIRDVIVTNPDSQTAILTAAFTINFEAINVPGGTHIDGNVIWDQMNVPYVVNAGGIQIGSGASLTILPGVVVKFGKTDQNSYVAWLQVMGNGSLIANGTEQQPIIFTSVRDDSVGGDANCDGSATTPAAGDWSGIRFEPGSTGSLSNVMIRYGGCCGDRYAPYAALDIATGSAAQPALGTGIAITDNVTGIAVSGQGTNVTVTGIKLARNAKASVMITSGQMTVAGETIAGGESAILVSGGSAILTGNTITGATKAGIYLGSGTSTVAANTLTGNATGILAAGGSGSIGNNTINTVTSGTAISLSCYMGTVSFNTIEGSGNNWIDIPGGTQVTGSVTWDRSGAPYVVNPGGLQINSDAILTIQPGVIVKFNRAANDYSYIKVLGKLIANGTGEQWIYFTSLRDDVMGGDTNGDGNASAPTAGDWPGIFFESGSTGSIGNALIGYAGSLNYYAALTAIEQPAIASILAPASGDGQSGTVGRPLSAPLIVKVTNAGGIGVSGTPITFSVTAGNGKLNGSVTQLVIDTDAQGFAAATFTLGSESGVNTVRATSAGLSGSPLDFNATGIGAINMTGGNNQASMMGAPLANPLVVTVLGASGVPIADIPVSFSVASGGGSVSPAIAFTDAQGQASTILTLGSSAGTNTVDANVQGLAGSPVSFTAIAQSISNPGFETGASPWTFYTNTAGAFDNNSAGNGTPHAGHVTVARAATNVQLFQSDVTLDPNATYQLSFKASSNNGSALSISLSQHEAPYTNYGLSDYVFYLTPAWSAYTVTFTTTGFAGTVNDGRLMIWFAQYATAGTEYFFDDVMLVKQ